MWGIIPPSEKIPEAIGLLVVVVVIAYFIIKLTLRYIRSAF